jgi:hypothetical protein
MKNGLAVQPDQLQIGSTEKSRGTARVKTSQIMMKLRRFVTRAFSLRGAMKPMLERGGKSSLAMVEQRDATFGHAAKRIIDGVDAGAGHDAENDERFHGTASVPEFFVSSEAESTLQ